VLAVLVALHRRRRTGAGGWIDLAQTEGQSALTGELLMEARTSSEPAMPAGSRRAAVSPHGFFPCEGIDRWIAICVESGAEWDGLCDAMGRPAWCGDHRFATLQARKANEDELEQRLGSWTSTHDAGVLMLKLQSHGVPAGAVLDGRDLLGNEQLRARNFFEWLDHAPHTLIPPKPYAGVPWRFSDSTRGGARRAPAFGEHTTFILRELLGYTSQQIESLGAAGALGSGTGAFRQPDPVPLQELQEKGYLREVDAAFESRIAQ